MFKYAILFIELVLLKFNSIDQSTSNITLMSMMTFYIFCKKYYFKNEVFYMIWSAF